MIRTFIALGMAIAIILIAHHLSPNSHPKCESGFQFKGTAYDCSATR